MFPPSQAKMDPAKDAIGVAPELAVEHDVMSFESKIKTDLRLVRVSVHKTKSLSPG